MVWSDSPPLFRWCMWTLLVVASVAAGGPPDLHGSAGGVPSRGGCSYAAPAQGESGATPGASAFEIAWQREGSQEAKQDSDNRRQRDRRQREGPALLKRAIEQFAAKDYAGAEQTLLRLVELDPTSGFIRYNLACCRAAQGDAAGGMERFLQAVERGFIDRRRFERDPAIDLLRELPEFKALMGNWERVLERHRDWNVERSREIAGENAELVLDDKLRLAYLSSFHATSSARARQELSLIAEWGFRHVFTELPNQSAEQTPWVVVVLPDRAGFNRWVREKYGNLGGGFAAVGGAYDDAEKRLVARDLGGTLRHEFFHVLHWRDNNRLGIVHPTWVQEGLCSLVEDYELDIANDPNAELRPVVSWRTNAVRRAARSNRLIPLARLTSMDRGAFTVSRPLANYGQARAVFLFLHERGWLTPWYRTFNETFGQDPTGVLALERVSGKALKELDNELRLWGRELAEVPEEIRSGRASLGLDVDNGDGEGPVIAQIVLGPPARAGLRRGDVITAIDGKPTRDIAELVRVLGDYEVGTMVVVDYRRGNAEQTAQLELVAR